MSAAAVVFGVCLLLLVYTFVGYPVLIALWARMRPWPLRKQAGWQPRVAMVLIAHNEAARIQDKLNSCLQQDYDAQRLRVVLASDGSTDATVALAKASHPSRVTVLDLAPRQGKAACINRAVESCDEEVLVFTDARQMLNPEAVSALVDSLSDPAVAVVSGELVFKAVDGSGFGQGVDAYWHYEKFIRKSEAAVHSVPGATGALYAMKRSAFRPIAPQTILDDVCIPMHACMGHGRVVFDARAQAYDLPATNVATERRRKVRTLAGNFQMLALMPQLLLPWRNPILLQFVSHKLMRLLAPWAMLGMLISSLVLAPSSAFFAGVLVAQLLFYGLAWLSPLWPQVALWKPARVAQAFVALNAFAVLGLVEFLTNRQAHLWKAASGSEPGAQP